MDTDQQPADADRYYQRLAQAGLTSLRRVRGNVHTGCTLLSHSLESPKGENWRSSTAWQIDRLTSDGRDGLDLLHAMQDDSLEAALGHAEDSQRLLAASVATRTALYGHQLPAQGAQMMRTPLAKFLERCADIEQRIQEITGESEGQANTVRPRPHPGQKD